MANALIYGKTAAGVEVPVLVAADGTMTTSATISGGGDASAANQTTEITKLTSIDGKTPALGQAVAGSSTPVVLPAAQITTLTPPAAITGFSTETTLAAQTTLMGAVNETAPASDTASSGHNGRLQRLAQRLTSILAGIPLLAGEAHIGEVGGNLTSVAVEFTRPADTTAYAVGDVVSDNTTTTTMQAIAAAARVSGGSGYIVGIRISTDKKSITPRLRIHFFNTNGATLAGDNVAHKEVYADSAKRVGFWDMPAMSTATDTTNSDMSRSIDMNVRLPYTCAATTLYYVLEALDAFTPASGEKVTVTVYLDRN